MGGENATCQRNAVVSLADTVMKPQARVHVHQGGMSIKETVTLGIKLTLDMNWY